MLALKRLWRADFFGIFLFNLLALFGSAYVSLTVAFAPLALAIAGGNLIYLFVLLGIRLRRVYALIQEDRTVL